MFDPRASRSHPGGVIFTGFNQTGVRRLGADEGHPYQVNVLVGRRKRGAAPGFGQLTVGLWDVLHFLFERDRVLVVLAAVGQVEGHLASVGPIFVTMRGAGVGQQAAVQTFLHDQLLDAAGDGRIRADVVFGRRKFGAD